MAEPENPGTPRVVGETDEVTTVSDPGGAGVVALAARNLAAWHRSSVEALGWRSRTGGGWWTCPLPGPTIYHAAISLRPAARRRRLEALLRDDGSRYVSVCDSFADLDLTDLGLDLHLQGAWFHRPPGPPPPASADGLRITTVADAEQLVVFEATTVRAFEVPLLVAPFDVHAPAILDDVAMTCRLGWLDDEPVSVAMAFETDVVGIYGVGTVPARRGRGFGSAMVADLLGGCSPGKATVLQPTARAEPMYRRLGFGRVGSFNHWV